MDSPDKGPVMRKVDSPHKVMHKPFPFHIERFKTTSMEKESKKVLGKSKALSETWQQGK